MDEKKIEQEIKRNKKISLVLFLATIFVFIIAYSNMVNVETLVNSIQGNTGKETLIICRDNNTCFRTTVLTTGEKEELPGYVFP